MMGQIGMQYGFYIQTWVKFVRKLKKFLLVSGKIYLLIDEEPSFKVEEFGITEVVQMRTLESEQKTSNRILSWERRTIK